MSDRMKRTLVIETEIDRKTLNNSEQVVKNFFDKYQDKKMKVSTPDFQGILNPIRDIEKEIDRVAKKMPHMLGSIKVDQSFLADVKDAFKDIEATFTDGSIAKGFDAIMEKTKSFSLKGVDLGGFLSSTRNAIKETTDALDKIGAIRKSLDGSKFISLEHLNITQLENALSLMQKLKVAQADLDSFNGAPLSRQDLYSNTSTDSLSKYLEETRRNVDELRQLNLSTLNELHERRELMQDLQSMSWGGYTTDDVDYFKILAKENKQQFEDSLYELRNYIDIREDLLKRLSGNSHLFQPGEIDYDVDRLKDNVEQTKSYLNELQQFSPKVADTQIGGDFTEVVRVLNEIKGSLQEISGVFQNTESSIRNMAESGKASFEGLSQTITEVYNNLTQIQSLVDTISKKDFNITNITQTGGGDSNLQAMTKQMAVAREQMEHLRILYDQAGDTIQGLAAKGQMDKVFEYQKQLAEFDLSAIAKSVKGANTEMKLASVLAEMQDYIDKFTQINELRNKFDLGAWKDTFVPTKQPVIQPTTPSKPQEAVTPTIAPPQNTIATTNAEAQHMYQLKAAIDEVSNAIGRKNAGFTKEAEIVNTSVEAEKGKLKELSDAITTTVLPALNKIKEEWAKSLNLPEINTENIQTSLDNIYNKFVTLQENIGRLQFSLDPKVNMENVSVSGTATETEQAVDGESQSANGVVESFTDATDAKKQFTEANKQVAKSAEETTKAVEKEAEAAKQAKETMVVDASDATRPRDWDEIVNFQSGYGVDPDAMKRSKTDNVGDRSVRNIVEVWKPAKDEDGNFTGELELNTVRIAENFKKRADAIADENKRIKNSQADLHEFLTQFDNKTMGEGKKLNGYQDLVALANKKDFNLDDIDTADQMMKNLNAEYNKVVQSMRKGMSSMNPFVNAINGMGKMEDVLRGIHLQFQTLKDQPEWLKNQIIDLYKQFDNLSSETDIYKFAEGFGNLRVSINSVTESIRQQRTEQKLATADFNALVKATKNRDTNTEKAAKEEDGSAWKTYYMDRAAEQQKIIDAIRIGLVLTEDQETQLNAMSEKHALILNDITQEDNKIEEQKQKYEEIVRLLEKNHADQIELDSDTSLDDSDRKAYQQLLNEERAKIDALIANTNLNPEQTKSVKQLRGSMEDDRIAKVKEYINLLRLQQDYEKKAAKEDEGSKMQSFYNDQIAQVKEKINQIDITAIENQDEKNKRLAIEEAHQRAIAEIEAKKNANTQKPTMPFGTEDEKVQKKYDAGYLSKGLFDDWQIKLSEYRNYMSGVTEADEATIANKKQSLMQMYDALTKMSNASKSFFASGGEILPKWLTPAEMQDTKQSLMDLYNTIATDRFEGMNTSVTGVNEKLGKLNFTVDDGKGNLTQYTIALDRASGATKLLENNTKPVLTTFQRFGQTLKKDFTGILHSLIGGSGVHAFVQYMRQGVQAVRELDSALTELKKVTDETEETYDRFLDTAGNTSARIGSTITDMTSATAEFAKLGYGIDQAAAMAESALVYANVGDNVDVETGSQSIISTLKAFGIEADDTMSIVDKFNEVGNNFAITTGGIGDALQVSASAMAAAGNSLDETIGLMTAANTIVQNPNTVGTALKTLSLRIRGVKTELEEAGLETDGMAETTSQLQAKLKALTDGKVDIMIDANNFKNTTEIKILSPYEETYMLCA